MDVSAVGVVVVADIDDVVFVVDADVAVVTEVIPWLSFNVEFWSLALPPIPETGDPPSLLLPPRHELRTLLLLVLLPTPLNQLPRLLMLLLLSESPEYLRDDDL